MAAAIKDYFETFTWLCGQGFLGQVPDELRTLPIYFGIFVLLFCLPLLMRKAGIWQVVLMALPAYWLGVAALAAWLVPRHGRFSEMAGGAVMLLWLVCLVLGLSTIVFNKGYRWATAGLVAANIYIAFFTAFVSGMAISGKWI